jgi:hypothetical protein
MAIGCGNGLAATLEEAKAKFRAAWEKAKLSATR